MITGSGVALVTPFTNNGVIDHKAFEQHVEWQISQGTDYLVPTGTTGESPTLSHSEHDELVELCIKSAKGRVPIMAGTGSNSTSEAISQSLHASQAGADALLIVTPYYNKPSQEGLYLHFKAIHDATDLPIYIYNIPPRSVIDMSVETMARLAELPRIVGVKDATSNLNRPMDTRLAIGPEFVQLSGEDGTVTAFLAQGGHGCISVTANVAPALCKEIHESWSMGNLTAMKTAQDKQFKLARALFSEPSPAPVKYALSRMGRMSAHVRLPIAPISEAGAAHIDTTLIELGLIN